MKTILKNRCTIKIKLNGNYCMQQCTENIVYFSITITSAPNNLSIFTINGILRKKPYKPCEVYCVHSIYNDMGLKYNNVVLMSNNG